MKKIGNLFLHLVTYPIKVVIKFIKNSTLPNSSGTCNTYINSLHSLLKILPGHFDLQFCGTP